MPIYEYVCAACGNKSEHLMRMSDPDPTDCPECGKPALSKALSAPSFRLAGSGWYETDFKKDGDKKRNLVGDGGAESKSTDAKPSEGKSADPAPAASKSADSKSDNAAPKSAPSTPPPASPGTSA